MNTLRNHFWNIILTIFFVALVCTGVWYLASTGAFFRRVGFGDITLMALAVWRLTRLFTYDAITKFIRDWFVDAKPSSLRGTLHTLLTCPWCTGLWFGFFVFFFYFLTPYAWPIAIILSIAAVGSFLQILSNMVGWNAEYKKLLTQKLQGEGQTHVDSGPTC
ncbi:MAG: DUF1360 domain-containing protein [Bacillota bacterium]